MRLFASPPCLLCVMFARYELDLHCAIFNAQTDFAQIVGEAHYGRVQHVDFLVRPFTMNFGIASEHENNAQLFKQLIKSAASYHTLRQHLPGRRFGIWMQLHCQISKPAECLSRRREYLPNLHIDECKTILLCDCTGNYYCFPICMRCRFKTNAPFSPHEANKQFLQPFAAAGVREAD